MPIQISPDEIKAIKTEIRRHPEGIGIDALYAALKTKISSRRTLQRRLTNLTDQGILISKGEARARIYLAPAASKSKKPSSSTKGEASIPIFEEAREIRDYVARPIQERSPIAYDGSLL